MAHRLMALVFAVSTEYATVVGWLASSVLPPDVIFDGFAKLLFFRERLVKNQSVDNMQLLLEH